MKQQEIKILRYIIEVLSVVPSVQPIVSKYNIANYYTNGYFTARSINDLFEVMLENIIKEYVVPNNGHAVLDNIYHMMYRVLNRIYNEIIYGNIDYVTSINIVDLLEIQLHPRLMEAIKQVDIERTREAINHAYDTLDNIIRNDPTMKKNTVAKAYISKQVNPNQVKQVLGPRGYVTELDSTVYAHPIASSFTLGMNDIYDVAAESRSGAKALYLSTKAIEESEYFARELQLVTMTIEKLEFGDCGSTDYMDWYVRPADTTVSGKSDIEYMIGKYYLNENTGELEVITHAHRFLEGKTIKLRTAMKCRHPDKHTVCSKCFGEMSYAIHKHTNLGHICAGSMTRDISQSILSTKHLTTSANTTAIILDNIGEMFFEIKGKDGYAVKSDFLKATAPTKLAIIIDQSEAFGIKDLVTTTNLNKIDPSRIVRLENIIVEATKVDGKKEYFPIKIKSGSKYGSFTYKFLEYIIEYGYTLDDNDRYVISLNKWRSSVPIIKLPQVEFSFIDMSKKIKLLLKNRKVTKDLESDETQESLLQKLFDLVNSKLNINIALLEVIIYAISVNSIKNNNYDLPRGNPNPEVADIKRCIINRSLGGAYGYEGVTKLIMSPSAFYPKNRTRHPLDVLVTPEEALRSRNLL